MDVYEDDNIIAETTNNTEINPNTNEETESNLPNIIIEMASYPEQQNLKPNHINRDSTNTEDELTPSIYSSEETDNTLGTLQINKPINMSPTSITPSPLPFSPINTNGQISEPIFLQDNITKLSSQKLHSNIGLATKKAREILFSVLEETILRIEKKVTKNKLIILLNVLLLKTPLRGGLIFLLGIILSIFLLIATILKYKNIPYIDYFGTNNRILVECILLFIFTIFYLIFNTISYYRKNYIFIYLLKKKYKQLIGGDFEFSMKSKDGNLFEGINMIPYCLIFVLRDGEWVKLPHILLVEGDIVHSNNVQLELEKNHVSFEPVNDKEISDENMTNIYRVTKTPLVGHLEKTFEEMFLGINGNEKVMEKMPLKSKLNNFLNVITIFGYIGLIIPIVVNLIRVLVEQPEFSYDWVNLMFIQPTYVTLFLIPLIFPFLWLVLLLLTNIQLLSCFEYLKTVNIPIGSNVNELKIPLKYKFKNFWKYLLKFNSNYFDNLITLGSITALCAINRTGLLADLLYAPERILFMKTNHIQEQNEINSGINLVESSSNIVQGEQIQEELHNVQTDHSDVFISDENHTHDKSQPLSHGAQNESNTSLAAYNNQDNLSNHGNVNDTKTTELITLEVLFDRTASKEEDVIRFQDPQWETHSNLLKPLGLSLFLTGSSQLPDFDKVEGMLDAKSHLWKKYAYLLGKEIGFSDNVIESFIFKKRIHIQYLNLEMSSIVVEYEKQEMQLHAFGEPELLLDYCTDYYSGMDIKTMTSSIRNSILDTVKNWKERRDLYCIAISYSPIDQRYEHLVNSIDNSVINITKKEHLGISSPNIIIDETPSLSVSPLANSIFDGGSSTNDKYLREIENMHRGQILLGVLALRQQPKHDLAEFIKEIQENSGIRFIHFSQYNTQKTKAFGNKIGMEVDWNCCISLNENDCVELDVEDLKAKLPHGIENIKNHIKNVDDVPLLVSLFSDSNYYSIKQMIGVLQDNNEVVCCIGSSINMNNSLSFMQSNLAISVDPSSQQHLRPIQTSTYYQQHNDEEAMMIKNMVHGTEEISDLQEDISPFLSFPCALHIQMNRSETKISTFLILYHLIKEGRRLTQNVKQTLLFLFGCHFSLFIVQLLSVVMALPSTLFNGVQILFLSIILIPLLSISILGTPMEPKIMNLISSKNKIELSKYIKLSILTIVRFSLPIPMLFVVYFWTIIEMNNSIYNNSGKSLPNIGVIWGDQIDITIRRSVVFENIITYAQTITMFFAVYYYGFLLIGTMHRVHSIFTVNPLRNIWFWISFPFCLLLQALYTFLSCIAISHSDLQVWPNYPPYAYVVVFVWPFIIIVLDELIKIRIRKHFFNSQQKAKLLFDTKLGMYSPK
ncbi:hypothetical protein ABK040_004403 [Willaertia magna]